MLDLFNSVLIVVDVQGRLVLNVAEADIRLVKVFTLVDGAKLLDLPILLTAQAPEKLGHTVTELAEKLPELGEIQRSSFNILAEPEFLVALQNIGRKQVILCGYEAHICIYQSAVALAHTGYEVYVVQDAVSSRDLNNKQVALNELGKHENVHVLTVEMLLFALLKDAKLPAFKAVSQLIR
ncbi:MAG TPA: isochorismatase family protein [Anaerolineaceae bacterium]|nr:isochorismatase family protein [Anaerolineaceae bacterium]